MITDFVTQHLPKQYPNIIPVQVTIHGDEFSLDDEKKEIRSPVHCHFDFIYVGHALNKKESAVEKERRKQSKEEVKKQFLKEGKSWDEKKWANKDWQPDLVELYGKSLVSGPSLQCSMTAALAEMGFVTSKGKGTAQTQFEEQVRHDLEDFAEEYGITINRTKGFKHGHMSKEVFQQKMDNDRKLEELQQRETNVEVNEIKNQDNIKRIKGVYDFVLKEKLSNKKKEEMVKNKGRELALKEIEIEKREELLSLRKDEENFYRLHDSYIETKFKEFDKSIDSLYAKDSTSTFAQKVNNFVGKCRDVFKDTLTELNRYRAAFKSFWKATPSFFRDLAAKMEKNTCYTFEDFDHKKRNGLLEEQIYSKSALQAKHEERKKQISRDYDWER